MKTSPLKALLCSISLVALSCGSSLTAAQPKMNDAIGQLELAKKHDPIEHLEKAKHFLEEAAHNKGGERQEAIRHINEAISAARKGERHRMEEEINKAIVDAHEGKHEARR